MTNEEVKLAFYALGFLTDQIWRINERLDRIEKQTAEETKQRNKDLAEIRHRLVDEVTA